jgi:hypothetical protein
VRPSLSQASPTPLLQRVADPATDKDAINSATRVWLARDDEFLFLAVRCARPTSVEQIATLEPRRRDTNLDARDRIRFRIDVNRDYQTAWELTVDDRGWANDSCHGDKTWNPRWFIASRASSTEWTVEAVIPLAELQSSDLGKAWAIQLERIIPQGTDPSSAFADGDRTGLDNTILLVFRDSFSDSDGAAADRTPQQNDLMP